MRRGDEILPDTHAFDRYADEVQSQFVIDRPNVLKMRDERYPGRALTPDRHITVPRDLGGTALGGPELAQGQQPGPAESATF